MFVLPSIILGFALSIPCIWAIFKFLFSDDMGISAEITPSLFSSIQALAIGVLIPALSAIIPIKRALKLSLGASLDI
jgi:ABC-type antimicrobial peptide transport system permease subunit